MVFAVPRAKGHLVLDMAMSQFSYGTLESYRKQGEQLPVIDQHYLERERAGMRPEDQPVS